MEDDFFDHRRERVEGTGDWIFNVQEFKEWDGGWDQRSRILVIQGPPGSGKSVLAAHIIEQLSKFAGDLNHSSEASVCVYPFCRHDDNEKQDLKAVLRTLIYDLAERIETYNAGLRHCRKKHE